MRVDRHFLTAAGVLALATASAASAQVEATQLKGVERFSIPSQSLGDALDQIQARYGVAIQVDRKVIRGLKSSAVVDAVDVGDATYQALAGTGLTANKSANGTTIGIGKPDPARLANDIVVTAPRSQAESSYKADSSETGTRTGGPSRNLPASTSVVTAQVLQDQQAQTIDDAVRNVGSTATSLSNAQGAQTYQVRGFTATTLSNGVASPASEYQAIDAVERVEVLKGPAAILQGEGGLGGTVNVVYKKPTTTKLLDLSAQIGSYDEYKVAIDAAAPLSPEGPWSARMVLSGLHQGRNFGGYDGGSQYLIAPSLRYKDAALDATVGINYSDFHQPFQPYSLFAQGSDIIIDRHGPIGFRNAGFHFETTTMYGDATYAITPWLSAVARGSRVVQNNDSRLFLPFYFSNATTVMGSGGGSRTSATTYSGDGYLRAKFDTAFLHHTVSGGYNISVGRSRQFSLSGGNHNELEPVDIYGDSALSDWAGYSVQADTRNDFFSRSQGYYIQDLIETGPLHLFGAVRRNLYYSKQSNDYAQTVLRDAKWTPSGGLVVDITKSISIYGNYSQGYYPSGVKDENGSYLPPVQSSQYEGGSRIDFNKHKATLTVSAFQITQKNLAQQTGFNPVTLDGTYVVAGGLRSRGVEGELMGEILPGWNVTTSVTRIWYDPVLQNNVGPFDVSVGLTKFRGSLSSVYKVQGGRLKGLGFGGGLFWQGDSKTQNAVASVAAVPPFFPGMVGNPQRNVPGYLRTDLSLYYRLGPVDATVGVRNVFDRKDYASSAVPTFVALLPPRTFRVTLTYHAF